MTAKPLDEIHHEVIQLGVLLRTLHTALPDDAANSMTDTRFIIGWAYRLAEQLANDIDSLDFTPEAGQIINKRIES